MKVQAKKLLFCLALSFLLVSISQADLAGKINEIVTQSSQENVKFSIRVVKADTGGIEYERNAKQSLIPASNMKIVTTAAALRYLGADYQYITKVGIQDSNLVIIGSGDPLLGDRITDEKYDRQKDWILEDIIRALSDKKIDRIEDIIIDTGIFDNELVHPSWPREELNRAYACEVSGLNYNDNIIEMSLENVDGKVNIFIEPQTSFVTLTNEVRPISTGESAVAAYRNTQPNKLRITGQCRNKVGPFEVAIERPPAFFGFVLAEFLGTKGINIEGQFIEKVFIEHENFEELIEYTTPISDCLNRCNKDSLNFAAESLLKTIAAVNNPDGKNGSWEKGREMISNYLIEIDVDENEFYIDDGCGLSRQNKLSANLITKVLLDVYNSDNWSLYKSSLAIAGVDGTSAIKNNFTEEKYKGKMLGKSGYISGVRSLSGICMTEGGQYIFSIITNSGNGQTREAINDIVKAIIDQ